MLFSPIAQQEYKHVPACAVGVVRTSHGDSELHAVLATDTRGGNDVIAVSVGGVASELTVDL
jgi:hypothetical protein